MFHEPWFWISFAGFFFNSNFSYHRSRGTLNGSAIQTQANIARIAMLGIIIFWILGLVVADKWWQPLATFGISLVGGSLLGALIDDMILPKGVSAFIGAMSPFVSLVLTIIAYIVWY